MECLGSEIIENGAEIVTFSRTNFFLAMVFSFVLAFNLSAGKAFGLNLNHFGKDSGLPEEAVRALCLDGDGELWIGTLRGGPGIFKKGKYKPVDSQRIGNDRFVRDLAFSSINRGEIWGATQDGAVRLVKDSVQGWNAQWFRNPTPGLVSPDLLRVIADSGGQIWLLPFDFPDARRGISYWDGRKFHEILCNKSQVLHRPLSVIQVPELPFEKDLKNLNLSGATLLIDQNGIFLIRGKELEAVDLRKTPFFRPQARRGGEDMIGPPVDLQTAIKTSDDRIFFVHRHAILILKRESEKSPVSLMEIPFPRPTTLGPWAVESEEKTIWCAGHVGPLVKIDSKSDLASITLPLSPGERVALITPAKAGGVWIVTDESRCGLMRAFPDGTIERLFDSGDPKMPMSPNAALEDKEGNLWIGAENGLFQFVNFPQKPK